MATQLAPTRIEDVATQEKLITGEELLAMGSEADLYELVEGRIKPMSPTGFAHGQYEVNFAQRLQRFVEQQKTGKVVTGEVGIYIRRDPDTIRAADVAYISNERLAQRQKKKGYLDVAPEIVVEIMSPDDNWSEVMQKMREYFSIGVKLIWVADPEAKTIYAYRSMTEVREFKMGEALTADEMLAGFSVPVAELFEE